MLQIPLFGSVPCSAFGVQRGFTDAERFQLDSGCQPVAIEVALSGESSDIGLTVPLGAGPPKGIWKPSGCWANSILKLTYRSSRSE